MSKFQIHDESSAPERAQPSLMKVKEGFGFTPNVLGILAEAPTALESYLELNEKLSKTEFSPIEQQVVILSISVANECGYCVAAHTASASQTNVPDHVVQAIREQKEIDDPKLFALSKFTQKMTEKRGWVTQEEYQQFIDAGYKNKHVLEIIQTIAMKVISNYTNHIAETPLDEPLQSFAWESND